MNIWIALMIFGVYALLDALYVYYTLEMTKLNPGRTAFAAVGIYGLSALGIVTYTTNPVYIIFVVLGAFCGTYFVVWREKKKQGKLENEK